MFNQLLIMDGKMVKFIFILHIATCILSSQTAKCSTDDSGKSNAAVSNLAVGNGGSNNVMDKSSKAKHRISSEQLASLHDYAKNISHSKGLFITQKSNGIDLELRRSVIRKASFSSESEILKELLQSFNNNKGDKLVLLRDMEYLVHQYDVAINFANMGGFDSLIPLLSSSNEEYASFAAAVLGAAMQGNPVLQKFAVNLNFGNNLVKLLHHKSPDFISKILFTLSSYLRNMPQAQEKFLAVDGVLILSRILKNHAISTNTKLKIVNLLSDLAVEHQSPYPEDQDLEKIQSVHKSFSNQIVRFGICHFIPSLLDLEDLDTHQKATDAMISLHIICFKDFRNEETFKRVRRLLKLYDPMSTDENPLYPHIDLELKQMMYNDLKVLHRAITVGNLNKQDIPVLHNEKSEL